MRQNLHLQPGLRDSAAVHDFPRFISLPAVLAITGLSKTTIYKTPDFPRPVKIGGAGASAQGGARWVESEVLDWMRGRIQARDTSPRPRPAPRSGRPPNVERAEAARRGLTVKELRAQADLELEGGAK